MQSLRVEDYMNKRPVTFKPGLNIAEAVEHLLKASESGGPVLDEAGKVIGFLSEQDCLSYMIESTYFQEQVAKVEDIMARDVLVLKPYSSVLEVAQNMTLNRPRIYPIVDDDGVLLGSISRRQVMRAIDEHLKDSYPRPD
ncbi:CBS domain-containing protein [Gayadomonas joobiniege]|uniref:CBS domain-containing protein n=1 Tax=Gayadomonas joobiniege TaxID=1234606 RepID=UPI00037CD218|nr:CBS domain-containing protein [Gayadomonas joobiniege]